MDNLPYYLGFATVIGTILGGFISTMILRSHKITGYRQDWINSLRNNFTSILSQCDIYLGIAYKKDCENSLEPYNEKVKLVKYIHEAKLFLNKDEKLVKDLLQILEPLPEKYFEKENQRQSYEKDKKEIAILMQNILKNEWNRDRDGEFLWKIKSKEILLGHRILYVIILITSILLSYCIYSNN
ncbi:MAG: hypothetical protein PF574_00025, partial [Candidatus Delongbacteria bacterium]|nr:hypothetical protein [Candidatus Delongbacteria bacterium]